jgi:cation:H+ antiporter
MTENILLFIFGLILLYVGAELLVRGASKLAFLARIQPMVVGLTVVAFGTSFPEFVTSMVAAWQDKIDMAVGNIVGSNIANICLILGVSGLIVPVAIKPETVKKELYWMVAASVFFILFSLGGVVNHLEGILLFSGIIAFTFYLVRVSLKERKNNREEKRISTESPRLKGLPIAIRLIIYFLMATGGIILMMFGSDWLVISATNIAREVGISEIVIGLSLVAFGTSLPELATAIVSLIKKEKEILIGNVIGSNIFNLLFVGGTLSAFFTAPIKYRVIVSDLPIMLIVSLFLIPIIFISRKISRLTGIFLLTVYIIYLVYIFNY